MVFYFIGILKTRYFKICATKNMNELNKKKTIFSEEDNKYMRLAIKLAGKGRGKTNPNPMVGAVIVKNGRIMSQGYHKQVGLAHAEIEAIYNSKESPENSTMYVTLEPCTLHGKTLPCVNEIVKHKFKKIIVGCIDPNPRVNGRGIEFLKKAGINVESGLLEDKIKLQNEVFFKQIKAKIPFVCCKVASSIDGKLATRSSDSKWITSEKSRKQVQNLRKEYGCVLTGINTILNDDPYLIPRKISGNASKTIYTTSSKKFYRVILDSDLKIALHPNINIIKTSSLAKTIVFTGNKKNSGFQKRVKELQKNKIDVLTVGKDPSGGTGLDILKILKILYQRYEITSILLECGPALLGSFLKRGLIDKFIIFFAPRIIGGDSDYDMFADLEINKIKDSINLKFENVKRI
jgi:diaminohydroxyphosphoribosylaminopyrimidine deaminase/5-amino-6-(5-phosphoribosylamino)uracil reductase